MELINKAKWFLLASFLTGAFSDFFVKLLGLKDTPLNTGLVGLVLMIIPTMIFIRQNKKTKDSANK